VKIMRWGPPQLPYRGAAILLGPLSWELEINPNTGWVADAAIGLRIGHDAWNLELAPRIWLMVCRGGDAPKPVEPPAEPVERRLFRRWRDVRREVPTR
jgi:hypothetical protein